MAFMIEEVRETEINGCGSEEERECLVMILFGSLELCLFVSGPKIEL